jgi:lipopolysaccharide/colanic/teichoic acid biosynthesis glycosyltransferase
MKTMSIVTRRKRAAAGSGHASSRQYCTAGVQPSGYFRWQAVRCRLAALVLMVPASPLIALLVVLVRLTSRGPGIYRQTRVGLDGKPFVMYKLRTMRLDAEVATGPVWTQTRDPRITPVGNLLRRLHLDEFPQLFNVLKGEMALIGPRPERPEFTQMLARSIPGYLDRLAVRPGITGLAQINLPPDTDLESVRRKLVLDLEYVEGASLNLDVRIFMATFLRLFHLRTSFLLGLLGLRRRILQVEVNLLELALAEEPQLALAPESIELSLNLPPRRPK